MRRLFPSTYLKKLKKLDKLEAARKETLNFRFGTINGTRSFQVVIFMPNLTTIKASQIICMCKTYSLDFGSFELFKEYEINN